MIYDFHVGDRVVVADFDGVYPEGQEGIIVKIQRDHTIHEQPLHGYDFLNVLLDNGEKMEGYYVRRFRLAEITTELPDLPDASSLFE